VPALPGAWLIKQKLMEVMRQRNAPYRLKGEVQIDDAYLGGEKADKVGRGAANKVLFVVAVETRDGKPIHNTAALSTRVPGAMLALA
jgi:hypothetical protein